MTNTTGAATVPSSIPLTTPALPAGEPPCPTPEPPGACSGPLPPDGGHSPARPSTSAVRGAQKTSVYDIVTERIVAALERGVIPWRKPWASLEPRNLNTGKTYRGINFFLLSDAGERFSSPYWLTFRQTLERGGHVRKGERGTPVFFWKVYDATGDASSEPDREETGRRFVARYYTVFNVEQCEGIEYPRTERGRAIPALEACDRIVVGYSGGPEIRHGGDVACYSAIGDVVQMPERGRFHSAEEYYSKLLHELVHSTGHGSRLARFTADAPPPPFGSADYSREELIAEMGAAFLCAEAGISNATIDNAAAYVSGWLKVLKQDSRAVVFAAAAARKAADRITGARAEGA